ncbi:hypothetical protein NMY22_g88 [Coprinellus aureogranulatus]|nr:hypothetical protein NMY22_g88 [Coprinellus aureogranulatus]
MFWNPIQTSQSHPALSDMASDSCTRVPTPHDCYVFLTFASPTTPCSIMSPSHFDQVLDGFALTEWPDLTCERTPKVKTHTSTSHLPNAVSQDVERTVSSLFLALARILGIYCGTGDILLAHLLEGASKSVLVRVQWSNEQTWGELALGITAQLKGGTEQQCTVSDLRKFLGLRDKQYPCLAAVSLEGDPTTVSASEFPLYIYYDVHTHSVSLTSSSTLIHPDVSDQLLAQVVLLLEHALANPMSALSPLPKLPSALSSVYNRLPEGQITRIYPHIPQVEFVTDYVHQRALSHPHAVAVRWFPNLSDDNPFASSESVTYTQLDERASKVARWLVSCGLRPEDRVALCLSRDIFFHAALMGILRAGGCYVPIDPDLPVERKAYIARDSNAAFVLTTSELSPPDLFGPMTVYVDEPDTRAAIEKEDGTVFNVANVEGLSYMLYTSGTTGNPKGCLLTNKGLAQAIFALSSTAAQAKIENVQLGRYLAVASIAFDVHLGETFVPMALGMPLFSASRSELLENLPHYVNTLQITHLGIVPSLIEATLNATSDDEGKTNLRYIASGGEKMSDAILDKWADHPQVRLANFYGPSEVTIGCAARYMDSNTPKSNVGRPFANVSGYVVDSDMQILPRGGIGELVVEGPLVGRGYHGRPDLTQKVFLQWPEEGCWAYRTGDLVRMLPDSTIEILGRIDTQIKLRGVRIESEGVSAIVRKGAPPTIGVSLDATTILAKHPQIGNDQLVSFVTWNPSVPISLHSKYMQHPAREYMRPSHIIPITWLPLSSNGKTDAKICRDIFLGLTAQEIMNLASEGKCEETDACNEVEEKVFTILQHHAPLCPSSAYPDLSVFECGLDSLAVIRFTSDLKEKFHKHLSASDVMKHPLLKDIAQLIQTPSPSGNLSLVGKELVPPSVLGEIQAAYPPGSIETVFPPFPIQQGVVSRSAELDSLYVQHVVLQCQGSISVSKLKEAWKTIISRHPMLRTVFFIDHLMLQVVLRPENTPDLWKEKAWKVRTENFIGEFNKQESYRITQDINHFISTIPPLRMTLYSLPANLVLVLSIHHALYDGVCLPLILSDLESAYLGSPMLPLASLDNILACISSHDETASKRFWLSYFSGFSKPLSPYGDGWQETTTTSGALTQKFKASLSSVKAVATQQQVTLQALLSHAFAKLIATRLYRSRDVCFGVIRSGRLLPVESIESAVCPTISLLPFRVNFQRDGPSLAHVQEAISAMIDHENVPLSQIQSWVRPGETLFDVVFSVSVHHNLRSNLWVPLNEDPPNADYPLAVEAVLRPDEDTLVVRAGWLEGYLTEDFVKQFLNDFEATAMDAEGLANVPIPSTSFDRSTISSPAPSTTPSNSALATELRKATSEFLRVSIDMVTDTTSFITLGLDSIKAVGLAKRFTKLGHKVTSVEILRVPTIQALTELISSRTSSPAAQVSPQSRQNDVYGAALEKIRSEVDVARLKLSHDDEVAIFPATALQAGMLSQTIASNGALYVHAFPMVLKASTDLDRLYTAWKVATDMFSMLRTSFHFIQDSGTWTQAVHGRYCLDWSERDITADEEVKVDVDAFLKSLVLDEESAFSRPPIWLRLYRPSSASIRPRLVLAMHHALYDGISVGKLLHSVECLYHGDPLPGTVQFSSLLPEIFRQEAEGTAFWAKHLHGFMPSPLPASTEGNTVYVKERTIILDPDVVKSVLGQAGVTIQCLFQASLAMLLSSLTGSIDVVFGRVVSGRSVPGSEDVIGPMLNTIPCRVKLGLPILKLLQEVHRLNLEVSSWQQASLRSIQRALGFSSLWDCLFTFQPMALERESIWSIERSENIPHIQYTLHIEVEQLATGFTVRAAARSDRFSSHTLSSLVDEFVGLTTSSVESLRVSDGQPFAQSATRTSSVDATSDGSRHPRVAPLLTPEPTAPPYSAIPDALNTVLEQVLPGTRDLKLHTPLSSIGIDSITAIQISAKLRTLGYRMKTADLVNARTLGDVVARLETVAMPSTQAPQPKVEDGKGALAKRCIPMAEYNAIVSRFGDLGSQVEHVLPMAPGMKYLLSGWQRSGASRYQSVFPYCLPANVDATRLRGAWKLLIKRHQMLRSTPATAPGSAEPRLVTFKAEYDFENWFEETLPDDTFHHDLISRMKACSMNPLSPSHPPVRAILYRSQSRMLAYLGIHLHHVLYDGMAIHMVTRCLSDMYRISEPTSDGNASRFLARFPLDNAALSIQETYWKSVTPSPFHPVLFPRLHIPRPLTMPTYLKRHTMMDASVSISASETDRFARAQGTSLNAVCIAVWASVQAKYAQSNDATFGLWTAARTGLVDDMENLVVPSVNIVPIHVSMSGDILGTSRQIRNDLLNRTAEVDQSDLDDIVRWTKVEGSCILNTTLNILRIPKITDKNALLEPVTGPYECPPIFAMTITPTLDEISYTRNHRNDLMVEVAIVEKLDKLVVAIDGDDHWMNREQAEKVLHDYCDGLRKGFAALSAGVAHNFI